MRFPTLLFLMVGFASGIAARPRLLVLTDIGGDPDDQQSMIRLLVHANEFEIEGLIASASGTPGELKEKITQPGLILEQIEAYAKVFPNLRVHADGFPDPGRLRALVKSGNPNRGLEFIGEGHDTEASRWIISQADRDDPRPLNITIWGGQTDLAQALWRVKNSRARDDYLSFFSRIRVYDINDQDRIHGWMFSQFPEVFYILAKAPPGVDKREGAYRGMYLGGDESLTSLEWIDANVRQHHGPLGALYPTKTWTAPNPHGVLKEGDTPSWFFFLPTGLGNPDHPEWGGWGGRFGLTEHKLYRDLHDTLSGETHGRATVYRWRRDFQHEFAARMDWCVAKDRTGANHPPVAIVQGNESLEAIAVPASPGETVALTAIGSTDPDGDPVRASWWIYPEAGTYRGKARIDREDNFRASLHVPADTEGKTIHVILEVQDNGKPPLKRYRRVIINIRPRAGA